MLQCWMHLDAGTQVQHGKPNMLHHQKALVIYTDVCVCHTQKAPVGAALRFKGQNCGLGCLMCPTQFRTQGGQSWDQPTD